MTRKFTMMDEAFECGHCRRKVPKLHYTARDHCPYCLHSRHVDIHPGDRACTCGGDLVPTGIRKHKKNYQILYVCAACGQKKANIAADDDDMSLIIQLSAAPT